MLAFALKRLGIALLVALTVSLVTFSMIYVSGDPAIAIAGEGARPADIEAIRKFYGFDRPIAVQYFDWLAGADRKSTRLNSSHWITSRMPSDRKSVV